MHDNPDHGRLSARFLRALGRREHSRRELESKALQAGFAPELIRTVLDELVAAGYQSDERFAENWARYQAGRGQGPRKIAAQLQQKGITAELIAAALAPFDWEEIAAALHGRKYNETPARSAAERASRQRFLLQRGFSFAEIKKLL